MERHLTTMRSSGKFVILVLLCAPLFAQSVAPAGLAQHKKPQSPGPSFPPATQVIQPLQPAAVTPGNKTTPPPPAEVKRAPEPAKAASSVTATAPRVSYQNGELTVVAENSSLTDVLFAIRAATGIKIEGAGGDSDRVMAKIGPAPVRDVLLSLLEGSRYDFAMLGSQSDPRAVERLVLTARVNGDGSSPASQPQSAQNTDLAQPTASADEDDDNQGFAEPPRPALPAQVKTPEQLLEDLKKLEADRAQQQRQQQNQQPSDPNAPRPARPERPK